MMTFWNPNKPVCNFQSIKNPVELNSLLSKLFCYITWLVISPDQTRLWTTFKRGLYVKCYCFVETIVQRFKNYRLRHIYCLILLFLLFTFSKRLPVGIKQNLLQISKYYKHISDQCVSFYPPGIIHLVSTENFPRN